MRWITQNLDGLLYEHMRITGKPPAAFCMSRETLKILASEIATPFPTTAAVPKYKAIPIALAPMKKGAVAVGHGTWPLETIAALFLRSVPK